MTIENKYIGDGVEASYDGYHIWLKTVDGNNHQIAMEPPVIKRFLQYLDYVKTECDKADSQRNSILSGEVSVEESR